MALFSIDGREMHPERDAASVDGRKSGVMRLLAVKLHEAVAAAYLKS